MFQIGTPIGTSSSAGSVSQQVTSTAASVGPYRFTGGTPSTSTQRRTSAPVSASPLHTRLRTRPSPSRAQATGSASSARSMEGTKCSVVTSCSTTRSAIRRGSRWASGSAMTTVAPTCSGQNSSHTDTSNEIGVLCSTRSPGASRRWCCIQASRLSIAR